MNFLNTYFNTNKLFIGVSMIVINIGSKYIIQDMSDLHTKAMSSAIFKQFVLICIFFTATRDIMTAIILTGVFSILFYGLLDDKKKINLWHSSFVPGKFIKAETYRNFFNDRKVQRTPLIKT
jgi:hypothetical protein